MLVEGAACRPPFVKHLRLLRYLRNTNTCEDSTVSCCLLRSLVGRHCAIARHHTRRCRIANCRFTEARAVKLTGKQAWSSRCAETDASGDFEANGVTCTSCVELVARSLFAQIPIKRDHRCLQSIRLRIEGSYHCGILPEPAGSFKP